MDSRKRHAKDLTPGGSADRTTKGPPQKKTATAASPASNTKGLRHFSIMLCKKVEEKGTTTYSEVADELVQYVINERKKEDPSKNHDEKNIRRRVYDALNVLMAMDIIGKNKKNIYWKGLPTSAHQDLEMLERERNYRRNELERKRETLKELIIQQVCFRNLVKHNHTQEQLATEAAAAADDTKQAPKPSNKIPLPFIVVNTHNNAVIQCNMNPNLTEVTFDFSLPFEINDDNTILKRLGMDRTDVNTLTKILPEDMFKYCQKHGLLDSILRNRGTYPVVAAKSAAK